jgi:hypothetical protein
MSCVSNYELCMSLTKRFSNLLVLLSHVLLVTLMHSKRTANLFFLAEFYYVTNLVALKFLMCDLYITL